MGEAELEAAEAELEQALLEPRESKRSPKLG